VVEDYPSFSSFILISSIYLSFVPLVLASSTRFPHLS
jgi:hypothetical protein